MPIRAILTALTIIVATSAPAAEPGEALRAKLAQHVDKLLTATNTTNGRVWSFAVAADTHIQYYEVTHSAELEKLLKTWIAAKVDFGVIAGDFGGPGHHEPFGRQLAKTPGCPPILIALGNHEMDRQGKKSWINAIYPGLLDADGKLNDREFYYSVDYRGCHFVFLDGDYITGGKWYGDEFSDAQLAWLAKDLTVNRGKTTFLFTHHPIEASDKGGSQYIMWRRPRVVALLRRFPDVKWVFSGHLHYDERVKLWGANSVHIFRQPVAVRVKGAQAELCRITPKGLVPYRPDEWNDLGKTLASRWSRVGGREVLTIGERTLQPRDVHARLGARAEGAVRPTSGETMLKLDASVAPADKKAGRPLQVVVSNTEFVPIVKGMQLTYDVRFEGVAHDEMALHLHVTFPTSRRMPKLLDTGSLPAQARRTGKWTWRAESLKGKAAGRWYKRTIDLTPLAGGWIDRITLVTRYPKPEADAPARLTLYLDNIRILAPLSPTSAPASDR